MNSIEKEILTNLKAYIGWFIVLDILILFVILFSMSVLTEHFMIRKINYYKIIFNLSKFK